jgi:hypothetical protein
MSVYFIYAGLKSHMRYIYLRIGHKVHINMDIKKWEAGFTYHGVGVVIMAFF